MAHFTTVPVVDGAALGQGVAVPVPRLLFGVKWVMYMVYIIYYMLCYYSVLCSVFYVIVCKQFYGFGPSLFLKTR